ncbi:hypothetical protein ACTNRH_004333 [Vibrio vulnificus]|uniref:hypothetical protein n=1 Tax=Vibrio vulnificus TaxID=672 RepID=UPI000D3E40B8|nr:hypothetical protein [Vibrio vulnificus]EGR0111317.1 hypothetical protein [Vibrio vulnificus]EIF5019696.1 hypothetical protein [Vibrio vulnificus]EIO4070069.1 hypothetical protein [Vibrio vulnificus]ELH0905381.1 hypothetical protein [Vibrio vulnificus]ELV8670739.1 hypothetical protein [Vibrio vulnificus]
MRNLGVKNSIESFLRKFEQREFDQQDVKLFFVDVRDYSEKSSFAREIGDFIAHPDLKTTGQYFSKLKSIRNQLKAMHERFLQKGTMPKLNAFYSEEEIFECLNNTICSLGFEFDLTHERYDVQRKDFIFCLVGILSTASIKVGQCEAPFLVGVSSPHNNLKLYVSVKTDGCIPEINLTFPILSTNCCVNSNFAKEFFPWGQTRYFVAERTGKGELIGRKFA